LKAENGLLGYKTEEALQTTMRFFPWTGPEKMDYEFLKLEDKRAVGDVWEPNMELLVERVRRSYPDFRAQDMKSTVQFTEVKKICGFPCFTIEAKAFVPMTAFRFPVVRPAFEDATGRIEIGYTFTAALNAELPWSGLKCTELNVDGHIITAQTNLNAHFVYRLESRMDLKPVQPEH
jgi:hypothetical protein